MAIDRFKVASSKRTHVATMEPCHLTRRIGTYKGKPVSTFHVHVSLNKGVGGTLDDWLNPDVLHFDVIAHKAADAAELIYREFQTRPETEITVFGPQGGKAAYRFVGWESSIWNSMCGAHGCDTNLSLPF